MAVELQDGPLDWARVDAATILRGEVGSGAHGTAVAGTDDRDEMGVCVEPPEFVLGLRRFEQLVRRDRPEGVRSQPGDLDLVVYGLRKYCSLALKGNPSVLVLLQLRSGDLTVCDTHGAALLRLAPAFQSKRAVRAFLGYMTRQRERLEGSRGQRNVKRPELVEAHGYDTKYAGHAIRLGYQGVHYAQQGAFPVPLEGAQLAYVRAVRTGEVAERDAVETIARLEAMLEEELDYSPLPDEPDYQAVNDFLRATYLSAWGAANPT